MTELMHLKHFSCKVMRRVCTVQPGFGCNYQVGEEAVQVNIVHPISCSKLNAGFGAKQYLVAFLSLDNCPLFINMTHYKYALMVQVRKAMLMICQNIIQMLLCCPGLPKFCPNIAFQVADCSRGE